MAACRLVICPSLLTNSLTKSSCLRVKSRLIPINPLPFGLPTFRLVSAMPEVYVYSPWFVKKALSVIWPENKKNKKTFRRHITDFGS